MSKNVNFKRKEIISAILSEEGKFKEDDMINKVFVESEINELGYENIKEYVLEVIKIMCEVHLVKDTILYYYCVR